MGIDKNFIVKNGIEVGTDLIYADVVVNNTGIGTTTPTEKLDVFGDGAVTGNFKVTGFSTVGGILDVGLAGTAFRVNNGIDPRYNTSRVGINTGDPDYNLEVIGDVGISSNTRVGGASTFVGLSSFYDHVHIPDNRELRFGKSDGDLAIYHNGSHSFIDDQGTGNLFIRSTSGDVVIRTSTNENAIVCDQNADVSLYFNNNKKLETLNDGIEVTGVTDTDYLYVSGIGTIEQCDINSGDIDVETVFAGFATVTNSDIVRGLVGIDTIHGFLHVTGTAEFDNDILFDSSNKIRYDISESAFRFDDNAVIQFGTGSDYEIDFNGSNLIVSRAVGGDIVLRNAGTDRITIQPQNIRIIPSTDNTGTVGTAANTWANGRFTDFQVDKVLSVREAIDLADSDTIRFGSSDDYKVRYDGSNFEISQDTDGNILIQNGNIDVITIDPDEISITPSTDNTGKVGTASSTWADGRFTNFTVDQVLSVRNAIDLADSDILRFGTGDDYQILYDGTNAIHKITTSGDIVFQQGDSPKFRFNVSSNSIEPVTDNTGTVGTEANTWSDGRFTDFQVDKVLSVREAIDLADSDTIRFGSSDDYKVDFNGTNLLVNRAVGGDIVLQNAGTDRITIQPQNTRIIPSTDNTGTVGTSANTWANGNFTNFTVNSVLSVRNAIDLADNDEIRFGSSDDYKVDFNGTNLLVNRAVGGDIVLQNAGTDRITIQPQNTRIIPSTDNTGTVGTEANTWSDGRFHEFTVDSLLTVNNDALVKKVLSVREAIDLADNDEIRFGSSDDYKVRYDGSDFEIRRTNSTAGQIIIQNGNADVIAIDPDDISIIPSTDNTGKVGTASSTWANGNFTNFTVDKVLTVREAIDLADADEIRFGSSDDYKVRYGGSNLTINQVTDGNILIQNNGSSVIAIDPDVISIIPSTDNTGTVGTAAYTWADGRFTNFTVDSTLSVRGAIDLADNDTLRFGTGDDYTIKYNGSNAIHNIATSGNIVFAKSGNSKFRFDVTNNVIEPITNNTGKIGSPSFLWNTGYFEYFNILERAYIKNLSVSGITTFTGNANFDGADLSFGDDDRLKFGDSGDLLIYHSGTNSYIQEQGAGSLYIQSTAGDVILRTSSNKNAIVCDQNADVSLYHNGSKRLETTSTGVTITNTLNAPTVTAGIITSVNSISATDIYGVKLYGNGENITGLDTSGNFSGKIIVAEGLLIPNNTGIVTVGTVRINDPQGTVSATSFVGDGASLTNVNAQKLDGINGASFIRSDADDNVSAHTKWQDNRDVRFGNDAEFRIRFNGADTIFRNYAHANGDIFFQGENTSGTNQNLLVMKTDTSRGHVILYENNAERFRTTSGGVSITGTASATTFSGSGASLTSIPNSALNNSTISGVPLGSNLKTLTRGTYLTGSNYNGSTARTWAVDATTGNTAGKVVARDASGNFAAGTITATLSGNATSATEAYVTTEGTTNSERFIVFADGGNANRKMKVDGGLKYNPSTNTITATTFAGNATTATNADNAGKLDGFDSSTSATASTVAVRNSSADIYARLFRSTYQNQSSISGAMAFRVSTTDNYIRFCSDKAAIRTFLDVPTRSGGNASGTWSINITGDAGTLDGINSTQFLRSDQSDTMTGALTIDVDNKANGALRINANQTNPNNDFYFAQEIISTLSGTTATTNDREQGGIYIDVNSTATGGNTSNEHRAYGIYIDLDTTGDSDLAYGIYADATATPSTGTTSEIYGVFGRAEDNGGAGGVGTVAGIRGESISDNSTSDIDNMYGGYFRSFSTGDTGPVGQAHGVYAEIEISKDAADHAGTSYVVRSEYDNNSTTAQTNTTYLFYGNYAGVLPTSAFGIHISDNVPNLFGGSLAAGETTINGVLNVGGTSVSDGEGGEIRLKGAPSGTLDGDVVVDVNTNNIRFFEFGGNNRGAFLDISQMNNAASTRILTTIDEANYLKSNANDTASGELTFNGKVNFRTGADFADGDYIYMGSSDDWQASFNSNGWLYINQKANGIIFTDNGTAVMRLEDSGIFRPEANNTGSLGTSSHYWKNVYATTFTGSLSGTATNADKLDNLDSSSFLRSNANDTFSGALTGSGTILTTGTFMGIKGNGGGVIMTTNDGYGNANLTFNHQAGVPDANGSSARIVSDVDGTTGKLAFWIGDNVTAGTKVNLTETLVLTLSDITYKGSKVWHAGNDGSGSGLDADKLDGQEGSYYRNASNLNAGTISDARIPDSITPATLVTTKEVRTSTGQELILNAGESPGKFTGQTTENIFLNSEEGVRVCTPSKANYGSGYVEQRTNIKGNGIYFHHNTTAVGEITASDTTWLRINQNTNKNIYTPRYIRADNGFFVDGTTKGINGSGNFIGGTIAGASDYGTLLRSNANDEATGRIVFSSGNDQSAGTSSANLGQIEIKQNTSNKDAFISFHIANDFATYFGLDGETNDLFTGGWSDGSTKHKIWHAGNDGSGSGLDADKLDGINSGSFLRSDAKDSASGEITFNGVVNFRNNVDLADNDQLRFGSGDDFKMFCDGSHMYMDLKSGIGNLYVRDGTTTRFTFDDAGHFSATGNITASQTITGNTVTCATLNVDTTANYGDAILNFDTSNARFDTPAEVPVSGCKIFGGKDNGTDRGNPANLNLGTWYGVAIVPTIEGQTVPKGNSAWICDARSGQTRQRGASYQSSIYPNSDNTGEVGNSGLTWSNGRFTNMTIDSTLSVRGAVDLADSDILRFGNSDDVEFFFNGSHFYLDLNSGGNNFYIRDGTTTRFTFDDNGSFTATNDITAGDRMYCKNSLQITNTADNNNKLLLGPSGSASKQHQIGVGANMHIDSATGGDLYLQHYSGKNTNIGMGSTKASLNVGKDITASGNITAFSDARLKDNIEVIPDALNKVDQIRGVTFTRNDTDEDKRHTGVIAQEVEEVLPEVVVTGEDGIKSVAYGNMVGLLVEAIKELKQEIKELKEERN